MAQRETDGDRSALTDRVRSLRLPKEPIAARRGPSLLMSLLVAGLAAAVVYFAYRELAGRGAEKRSEVAAAAPRAESPPDPRTVDTAAGEELVLEAKGYIIPARQVLVSPKISGMIERLPIVEGQRVQKGTVLAELEKTDYQADVDRAQAALEGAQQRHEELQRGFRPEEVEQAKAELAEAQVQLAKAKADWQRNSTLWSNRAISEEQYQAADSQRQALERRVERLGFALKLMQLGPRQERVAAAAADVRQAQAELAKAQWRLENCTIRAPITGTILKKNAEEGNIVNPIAFNGSFSVCDLADLSDMEVELTIQERDISRVFAGQPCRIRADAYPARVYSGRVARIMPIADRAKGAVPVRVKISIPREEEGVYLKPEMGAVVSFLKKAPADNSPPSAPAPAVSATVAAPSS